MIKPGDTLVATCDHPTSWKTALVISVDHGKMPYETADGRPRPAGALLLVNGPALLQRDFTWIARNFKHVEADEVP